MVQRVSINLHLSGTIALADFVKIASLVEVEDFGVGLNSASNSSIGSQVSAGSQIAAIPEEIKSAPSIAAVQASETVAADDGEIDAHGHPWSADLHASTKAKTGAGLWRMKPGASRPDPLPGFPKEDAAGTASTSAEPKATNSATTDTAAAPAEVEDEDEFAAFRNALGDSKDPVVVPARKWTDADLGALSNQAAVKLGDPAPIKALVAQFVPEGVVAHSRNIPDDKRAEFAKAVEEKAGIEFAG